MKRCTAKILSLAICLVLIFINLTSCALLEQVIGGLSDIPGVGGLFEKNIEDYPEDERAFALFDKLDASMKTVSSYEEESLISMKFNYSDAPYSVTLDGFTKIAGNNTDDYFEYSEVEQTVYAAGGLIENFTVSQAYSDGKMYFSQKQGNVSSKMFSNTTYEEYLECRSYASNEPLDMEITKLATVTEATRDDNGLWSATYKGFSADTTKSSLLSMVEDSLFAMITENATLADMEITLKSDSELRPRSCDIEFIFASKDETATASLISNLPSIKINVEYEDYNVTSKDDVDLTGYSEVDNLPIIYKLFVELREIKNRENGTVDVGGYYVIDNKTAISEKYSGTYSSSDSGYKFNVTHNYEGSKYTMDYRNETLTIVQGNGLESSEISELVAKETISSIIDPALFSIHKVLGVTLESQKGNTAVYNLKINSKNGPEYNIAKASGGSVMNNEAMITATFVDGQLTSYRYESSCTIRISGIVYSCTIIAESKF